MKTQQSNIEKEIKEIGLTLFNYYYNYVDPISDLGFFKQLQEKRSKKLDDITAGAVRKGVENAK